MHSGFFILTLLEVVKAVLWAPRTAPGNSCFYPPLIRLLLLLFWSFWLNWVQNCTAASPPLSMQFLGWLPPVVSQIPLSPRCPGDLPSPPHLSLSQTCLAALPSTSDGVFSSVALTTPGPCWKPPGASSFLPNHTQLFSSSFSISLPA